MVTLDHKIQLHPQVVDTELDDHQLVLLHLETTTYYSLNLTGRRIWQGLKQGRSLREISARLHAEFTVEQEQAERSVLTLVGELLQHNLVQVEEGGDTSGS